MVNATWQMYDKLQSPMLDKYSNNLLYTSTTAEKKVYSTQAQAGVIHIYKTQYRWLQKEWFSFWSALQLNARTANIRSVLRRLLKSCMNYVSDLSLKTCDDWAWFSGCIMMVFSIQYLCVWLSSKGNWWKESISHFCKLSLTLQQTCSKFCYKMGRTAKKMQQSSSQC